MAALAALPSFVEKGESNMEYSTKDNTDLEFAD